MLELVSEGSQDDRVQDKEVEAESWTREGLQCKT
jgi:hypothetical protein